MKLDSLDVTFHRTVRVPEGRLSSNLPPSLGRMELYRVSEYDKKCPKSWERKGFFMALHDTEAMWMSFNSLHPVAILVGAGGVNALTGEKLGTTLEKGNYLVTPPQPWLDGWKSKDGTVYQFISTPYKKGKGNSVAEQLIGEESKTGALGLAIFDPLDRTKLKSKYIPHEVVTKSFFSDDFNYPIEASVPTSGGILKSKSLMSSPPSASASFHESKEKGITRSRGIQGQSVNSFTEMGIGKGGKIIQKVYEDPYGLEMWKDKPEATLAIYLVNAYVFSEITGINVPIPVGHESYDGHWFGLNDKQEADIEGSDKFTGLKSSVFPASNMTENKSTENKPTKQQKVTAK